MTDRNAVAKALWILDLLTESPEGLRPVDLAQQTGYPPGTLHRLLKTLVSNGYVQRDFGNSTYRLGPKFLRAFSTLQRGLNLREIALPNLKVLAKTTQVVANLGILHGSNVLYLDCIQSDDSGPVMYWPPGTLAPIHCTSLGKALVAWLPSNEREQILQSIQMTEHTPHTITTPDQLERHLDEVRQSGFAVDDEEKDLGWRCIGAPIRDHTGQVIAAASVSFVASQLPRDRFQAVADIVINAATATSTGLGYEANH